MQRHALTVGGRGSWLAIVIVATTLMSCPRKPPEGRTHLPGGEALAPAFPPGPCQRLMQLDASRLDQGKATQALDDAVLEMAKQPEVQGCVQVGQGTEPITAQPSSTNPIPVKPGRTHEQGDKPPAQHIPVGAKLALPSGPEVKILPVPRFPLSPTAPQPSSDPDDPGVEVFTRTDIPGVVAGYPEENQVASGHHVVFYTGNSQAYYSVDEGRHFTSVNPATVFGNVDGGFCCDQVVRYASSINRFLWLLQGSCNGACPGTNLNRYRLAVATPEAIATAAQNGNPVEGVWSMFDLPAGLFNETTWFDFPDMSVSNRALYMIWDCFNRGSLVARMSLADLASGTTRVFYWNHLTPIFGRAVQNPGNTAYFVTNDAGGDATITNVSFSTGDSPLMFTFNVTHSAVPDRDYTSDTGFGVDDWANRKPISGSSIGGATIGGPHQDQLWIAWTGGRGFAGQTETPWPQPHVHYVGYRLSDLTVVNEADLFNSSYAIEFPYLGSDAAGNVAISFSYGGPMTSNRPAAGILYSSDPTVTTGYFDVGVGDTINPTTIPAGLYLNRTQGDYTTVQRDGDNPHQLVTGGPFDKYDGPRSMRVPRDHWSFARFGVSAPLAPPTVRILSPADGSTLSSTAASPFHGSAVDYSNAPITDTDQLQWSIDGAPFANGMNATLTSATIGSHTVQLSALDAAGRTGSASIRVQVVSGAAGGQLFVAIDAPSAGLDYPDGATSAITFRAHGTSSSGSALQDADVRWTDTYRDAHGVTQTIELGRSLSLTHTLYTTGLSPTAHTITITVTDPVTHATVTDSVPITVGVFD